MSKAASLMVQAWRAGLVSEGNASWTDPKEMSAKARQLLGEVATLFEAQGIMATVDDGQGMHTLAVPVPSGRGGDSLYLLYRIDATGRWRSPQCRWIREWVQGPWQWEPCKWPFLWDEVTKSWETEADGAGRFPERDEALVRVLMDLIKKVPEQ